MEGNPETKTSRLRKIFACKIWNSKFGIWNTAQGFRNPLVTGLRNSFGSRGQRISNPVPGIRNPRRRIQNPRLS